MSNWQDMKSAPKDGTPILIHDGEDQFVAHWKDVSSWHKPIFAWCYADIITDHNDYLTVHLPEGWQPLPTI